jgi:hypothetical protein
MNAEGDRAPWLERLDNKILAMQSPATPAERWQSLAANKKCRLQELLHRELSYSGIINDEMSYSASLLAVLGIENLGNSHETMGKTHQHRQTPDGKTKGMNNTNMDSGKEPIERDPDLAAAEIAMKRAAVKARQKARQAGVGVVVWKDGQVVEERQNSSADE